MPAKTTIKWWMDPKCVELTPTKAAKFWKCAECGKGIPVGCEHLHWTYFKRGAYIDGGSINSKRSYRFHFDCYRKEETHGS